MLFAVVLEVSGALVAGAAWGIYGKLPERVEGFLVALAGGALLLSVTSELIEPDHWPHKIREARRSPHCLPPVPGYR